MKVLDFIRGLHLYNVSVLFTDSTGVYVAMINYIIKAHSKNDAYIEIQRQIFGNCSSALGEWEIKVEEV